MLIGALLFSATTAARASSYYSASIAGRYHTESTVLPQVPYGDGDWSTVLGLEAHDDTAYWQFAVDLAYGADKNKDVSFMATPQVNLMFSDRSVLGGVGVLGTYIQDDVAGDAWTDIYYQFTLGFDIPLSRSLRLTPLTHYVFAEWNKLGDFDFADVEYSIGLAYRF